MNSCDTTVLDAMGSCDYTVLDAMGSCDYTVLDAMGSCDYTVLDSIRRTWRVVKRFAFSSIALDRKKRARLFFIFHIYSISWSL
jgi:hypothetical protein